MGSIEKGIKSKPQNVNEIISGLVCRCFLDGFSKISGVKLLLFKSTKKMHYGKLSDKSFIYCHGLFQICGTTSLSLGRYSLEKAMAPHSSTLAWKTPWMGAWQAAVHGVAKSRTQLSDFTLTFHFHTLEKEMATHSSILAWKIPWTEEPGGLLPIGSHRVGHD